jgi:hypothetical protein
MSVPEEARLSGSTEARCEPLERSWEVDEFFEALGRGRRGDVSARALIRGWWPWSSQRGLNGTLWSSRGGAKSSSKLVSRALSLPSAPWAGKAFVSNVHPMRVLLATDATVLFTANGVIHGMATGELSDQWSLVPPHFSDGCVVGAYGEAFLSLDDNQLAARRIVDNVVVAKAEVPGHVLSDSVAWNGDSLFVVTARNDKPELVALDIATEFGTLRWSYVLSGRGAVSLRSGLGLDRVAVVEPNDCISLIDLSGQLLWRRNLELGSADQSLLNILAFDTGIIVARTARGRVIQIDPQNGGLLRDFGPGVRAVAASPSSFARIATAGRDLEFAVSDRYTGEARFSTPLPDGLVALAVATETAFIAVRMHREPGVTLFAFDLLSGRSLIQQRLGNADPEDAPLQEQSVAAVPLQGAVLVLHGARGSAIVHRVVE